MDLRVNDRGPYEGGRVLKDFVKDADMLIATGRRFERV